MLQEAGEQGGAGNPCVCDSAQPGPGSLLSQPVGMQLFSKEGELSAACQSLAPELSQCILGPVGSLGCHIPSSGAWEACSSGKNYIFIANLETTTY